METHEKKTGLADIFLRTIAVLGLIAILLLGAWGIIQLAFAIPSVFGGIGESISSLFTHSSTTTPAVSKETVTATAPANVTGGQPLQLSWLHSNADTSGQYSYAVSYVCQAGLSVKAPLPTGNYQSIPCNTPFNYVNATEHMTVVPQLTGSVSVPLVLTVTATKLSTGAITASGSVTTTVAPGTGGTAATPVKTTTTVKPTTSKPAATYYAAPTRAALYGYGDLAVTINSVTPTITQTSVKFTVANTGTNVVNAGWTFNATLPINGSYSFASQPQQALYPGDKIVYTLTFNAGSAAQTQNPYGYSTGYPYATGYTSNGYNCNGYNCSNNNYVNSGYSPYTNYAYATGVITISVDPMNYVPEYNKNNNIAQTTVPLY